MHALKAKSTEYCRLLKNHHGDNCTVLTLFSVCHCRLTLSHRGAGVYWMISVLNKESSNNTGLFYFGFHYIYSRKTTTIITVNPTAGIAHLGSQYTQDYTHELLINYTSQKWDEWRKSFEHQTCAVLKLCNINKEDKQ